MTRYASHYVYVPGRGFLKQWGVEVADGYVVRTFQLTEERGGVEGHPSVIVPVPDVTRPDALIPYLYYPFDFSRMQPAVGTRRRRLL